MQVLIALWCAAAMLTPAPALSQTPQTPPTPQTPATLGLPPAADAAPPLVQPPFGEWLEGVRTEALARGISAETVERALTGVEPVARILERDRAQAEFTLTTTQYLQRRLTRETLRVAKQSGARHRALLDRVEQKYNVPSRFLVAVWGLESNFGRFAGVRPMIPTLATLAYEPRRAAFFRQQLFDALHVIDRGYIELPRLNGSWAGAMGQPQFMPSSYLAYAQDFDGDGRRDIWDSSADVFASIAFYLQSRDWKAGETWGRPVALAERARAAIAEAAPLRTSGCRAERQLSVPLPLDAWRKLGVLRADKRPLPTADLDASLLQTDDGQTFLVYANYEALLGYNCAHTYALSVSMLSDAIDGIAPLPAARARSRSVKPAGKISPKSRTTPKANKAKPKRSASVLSAHR